MSALCEVCGAGYYLLSGYCDHCNSIQAGSEPHRLHLEIKDIQSRLTAAETRVKELDLLARRAYPDLKNSGICSAHCESGHYECELCYPDWSKLLEAHMKVKDNLRAELDKLKSK